MSRRLIIPFFIPFRGCPAICVYCDQKAMTGERGLPSSGGIREKIEAYLDSWKGGGAGEVAFYGGTFTAMDLSDQAACLAPVEGFIEDGRIDGIRVSTRPDCLSPPIAAFLRERGVRTVELGAQSMDNGVLELSGRGHGAKDTANAVRILREAGLSVGIQLMPGLPGDDRATSLRTARSVIDLGPDFVRIYPTVVMKDTALEKMYREGSYSPWEMDEMLEVCTEMAEAFLGAGIRIIRMGLQRTDDLVQGIVAGPYHPAFGDLVKGRLRGA